MSKKQDRLVVERENAGNYLLLSLIAYAATMIGVRWFLELTGYPQVGNSTLHIAHMLWGALLLFVAVLVALIWDNFMAIVPTIYQFVFLLVILTYQQWYLVADSNQHMQRFDRTY